MLMRGDLSEQDFLERVSLILDLSADGKWSEAPGGPVYFGRRTDGWLGVWNESRDAISLQNGWNLEPPERAKVEQRLARILGTGFCYGCIGHSYSTDSGVS
jgi:hypothetical protein